MSIQFPSSLNTEDVRAAARPASASPHGTAGRQALALSTGNNPPALPDKPVIVEPEQVNAAVSQLNDYARNINRQLEFRLDNEINQVIVRVYNADTEELIRQIPSEEALTLARRVARDGGLFLDERA